MELVDNKNSYVYEVLFKYVNEQEAFKFDKYFSRINKILDKCGLSMDDSDDVFYAISDIMDEVVYIISKFKYLQIVFNSNSTIKKTKSE